MEVLGWSRRRAPEVARAAVWRGALGRRCGSAPRSPPGLAHESHVPPALASGRRPRAARRAARREVRSTVRALSRLAASSTVPPPSTSRPRIRCTWPPVSSPRLPRRRAAPGFAGGRMGSRGSYRPSRPRRRSREDANRHPPGVRSAQNARNRARSQWPRGSMHEPCCHGHARPARPGPRVPGVRPAAPPDSTTVNERAVFFRLDTRRIPSEVRLGRDHEPGRGRTALATRGTRRHYRPARGSSRRPLSRGFF